MISRIIRLFMQTEREFREFLSGKRRFNKKKMILSIISGLYAYVFGAYMIYSYYNSQCDSIVIMGIPYMISLFLLADKFRLYAVEDEKKGEQDD